MLHSIRWRLVASFVLVTLLTVSLIGIVALSLIRQQTIQQEQDYLTANAEAVARQALPLMQPILHQNSLQELARTSAFLSNARVRIVDSQQNVLADSGPGDQESDYVWLVTGLGLRQNLSQRSAILGPIIMALPLDRPGMMPHIRGQDMQVFRDLEPGTPITVIRQRRTPWGSQVTFETEIVPDDPADLLPQLAAQQEELPERHRSTQAVLYPIGGKAESVGYVELSAALDFGAESLETAQRAFLLSGLGAALLALVVGLLVSRGLAAPISELTAAAGHMGAGDLAARAPVQGKDEIGQLAEQFNRMANRLQASFAELAAERDALRRFIADASHELRTPITALRSFNELMQGPAADDAEARAEFLAEGAVQLNRLEWITQNLLDLSRLQAGLVNLEVAEHDLGEVLEAAAAPFRAKAQEQGVELSVEAPASPIILRCDRPRLEMALSNLLDNALKFTPPGGRITLAGEAGDDKVLLWVEDTGIGVDPVDQPRIFDRFYRGQNADVQGSGLGLAIVQGIVQAHGGAVTVDSELDQGSRFTIQMPC